ncbi:MAG: tetratricopeptide repeat protein [Bradyrhizobium sp.]|nr:tetratricopeptide repeat protein [Bradyrhizobium sp.]
MTSATASPPSLDDGTTAAIQQALSLARFGRLTEACAMVERALAAGGDKVALNALLGMLRLDLGEHEAALRSLEIAHAARPSDVRIATNFATALTAAGDLERAFDVASRGLAFSDPTLQLARIRGYAAQMTGRFTEAAEAYGQVVRTAPDDWESLNNLGNARMSAGDFDGAIADLERVVALAPDAAPALINLARAYRESGQTEKAETLLRKMADDFPEDPLPLIDLHDLLKAQAREDEILEVVDRALERKPNDVELLLARARHFGATHDMAKAEIDFRRALAIDPANGDGFVGLTTVYEHTEAGKLQELAEEAEQRGVERNALNLVRAFAHRRARRYEEGVAALALVDEGFEGPRQEHVRGQLLEGLGDYDGAFAAFTRMNQAHLEEPSNPLERAASMRELVRDQLAQTTGAWFESWKARPTEPERRLPVFLVGFPRSGTTLLDTILMGHPDTVVMEEQPVINRLKAELGGFEAIAGMDEASVRSAQRRYFEIAGEYADLSAGSVLVDKLPLLLNEGAFIHRLFPGALFLFALRHPADVLTSCYVANFNLNNAMCNFLRLDTGAEFYDLTMQSWENARKVFPLNVHTVVYEEMVQDPPGVLRPVVEAIGLDWHDDMLDHTKTAAERGLIKTASYAQVTQPIYTRSVGRWQHYRKHLEPILPVLAPWIEKFGYTI